MATNRSITAVADNKLNKETSIPTASQSSAPNEQTEAPAKTAER